MTSPSLYRKRLRTDCLALSPLQFRHSSQTNKITSRGMIVNVRGQMPTLKRRKMIYHTPSSAYVGQTGWQLSIRVKDRKGADRRQDKNSLLALHCLTTDHTIDWEKESPGINAIPSRHGIQRPQRAVNTLPLIPVTERWAIIRGVEGMRNSHPVNSLTPALRPHPPPLPTSIGFINTTSALHQTYHIYADRYISFAGQTFI